MTAKKTTHLPGEEELPRDGRANRPVYRTDHVKNSADLCQVFFLKKPVNIHPLCLTFKLSRFRENDDVTDSCCTALPILPVDVVGVSSL